MAVLKLDQNNFDEVIKGGQPVVVDFWAAWCGPCRMISPIVEELADAYEGRVIVGKVNIDEQPDLAVRYRVASIPTLIRFENGQPVETLVGARPKQQVEALMQ